MGLRRLGCNITVALLVPVIEPSLLRLFKFILVLCGRVKFLINQIEFFFDLSRAWLVQDKSPYTFPLLAHASAKEVIGKIKNTSGMIFFMASLKMIDCMIQELL